MSKTSNLTMSPLAFIVSTSFFRFATALILFQFLFYLLAFKWVDPDIDAFLYLGARLDQGHLLYISDFETKLPLIQYLFWLAYKLGGIGSWRIISFLLITTLAYVAAKTFAKSTESSSHKLWGAYFSIFLLLNYCLPGAESSHIESLAAACVFLALALIMRLNPKTSTFNGISIGILLAIAVSIKQNYLFILPLIALPIFNNQNLNRDRLISLLIIVTSFSLFTALQFTPYLFEVAKFESLKAGLIAMKEFPHGLKFKTLLSLQLILTPSINEVPTNNFFYSALYFSSGLVGFALIRNGIIFGFKRSDYVLVFYLLSILALECSFLRTHYWPHYDLLFTPFFTVLIIHLSCEVTGSIIRRALIVVLLILFLLIPALSIKYDIEIIKKQKFFNFDINERVINKSVLEFTKDIKENGYSFYTPFDPVYHRLLGESRIGDGHPEMLHTVLDGKFRTNLPGIHMYSKEVQKTPCLAIENSDKDFILVWEFDYFRFPKVFSCLAQSKVYENVCKSEPIRYPFIEKFCGEKTHYLVFSRKDDSLRN